MRHFLVLITTLFFTALPAIAEEIVAELSQTRVSITANFDGSEILVYGAVRRESPIPEGELGVLITVEGPAEPVIVRRKARRLGIWVNTEAVEVDSAPSFYALATSGPLASVLTETEDLRHKLTISRAIRSIGAPMNILDAESFTDALIRIRMDKDLYQMLEGDVLLSGGTLFSTSIALPANLTQGDYRTRIVLTRNGEVVDLYQTSLNVGKVGLEKFIFTLAHSQPFLYGLLSLAIAIAAGWSASAFFRYIRG